MDCHVFQYRAWFHEMLYRRKSGGGIAGRVRFRVRRPNPALAADSRRRRLLCTKPEYIKKICICYIKPADKATVMTSEKVQPNGKSAPQGAEAGYRKIKIFIEYGEFLEGILSQTWNRSFSGPVPEKLLLARAGRVSVRANVSPCSQAKGAKGRFRLEACRFFRHAQSAPQGAEE